MLLRGRHGRQVRSWRAAAKIAAMSGSVSVCRNPFNHPTRRFRLTTWTSSGCALIVRVLALTGTTSPADENREAAGSAQQPAGPLRLVAAVADVRLPLPVHHEGVPADPDLRLGVVLGVEGEDATGADHEVVDVGPVLTDFDRVHRRPPRVLPVQLVELGSDHLLPVGTDPPRPLLALDAQESIGEGPHRRCLAGCHGLLPGHRSGWPRSEVLARGRSRDVRRTGRLAGLRPRHLSRGDRLRRCGLGLRPGVSTRPGRASHEVGMVGQRPVEHPFELGAR